MSAAALLRSRVHHPPRIVFTVVHVRAGSRETRCARTPDALDCSTHVGGQVQHSKKVRYARIPRAFNCWASSTQQGARKETSLSDWEVGETLPQIRQIVSPRIVRAALLNVSTERVSRPFPRARRSRQQFRPVRGRPRGIQRRVLSDAEPWELCAFWGAGGRWRPTKRRGPLAPRDPCHQICTLVSYTRHTSKSSVQRADACARHAPGDSRCASMRAACNARIACG